MKSKILCAIFPIALLIQIFNKICSEYNIFNDFVSGLLTRISGVLMIIGLPIFVYIVMKNKNKLA